MAQINLRPGNFKPTATGTFGYSFDAVGRPVRVNADGSTTPLAEASDQTPVITSNLGVGILADRPSGAIGDVYVAFDTLEVHTKVDAVTWNVSELVEGSFVTDETKGFLYQVYANVLNVLASNEFEEIKIGSSTLRHNIDTGKLDVEADIDVLGTVNGRDVAADGEKLDGIEKGAEVNVNADWNATTGDSQILNKPTDVTDLSLHNSSELSDGSDLVKGPASSTNNAIAKFNSTTGKVVQDSPATLDDDGNIAGLKDTSTETVTIDSSVQLNYDSVNEELKFTFL